jgi:hypothetical protein
MDRYDGDVVESIEEYGGLEKRKTLTTYTIYRLRAKRAEDVANAYGWLVSLFGDRCSEGRP